MLKMIPTVSVGLLMEAYRRCAADHEAGLEPDVMVSIVSALHGRCSSAEMIAISHRLTALSTLLQEQDGRGWKSSPEGKEYVLVNEALIRAAATAPLAEAKMVLDLRFDPVAIMQIALENSRTDGSA